MRKQVFLIYPHKNFEGSLTISTANLTITCYTSVNNLAVVDQHVKENYKCWNKIAQLSISPEVQRLPFFGNDLRAFNTNLQQVVRYRVVDIPLVCPHLEPCCYPSLTQYLVFTGNYSRVYWYVKPASTSAHTQHHHPSEYSLNYNSTRVDRIFTRSSHVIDFHVLSDNLTEFPELGLCRMVWQRRLPEFRR